MALSRAGLSGFWPSSAIRTLNRSSGSSKRFSSLTPAMYQTAGL